MAIYKSSDSLTRCDPNRYDHLFEVNSRPKIKSESSSAPPIHKDTLEISKDKLKKEALERLRHTSKIMVAYDGFMRIGKTLFLAIGLPPYLLVFGLPKWMLTAGIPAMISYTLMIWKHFQSKLKQQIEAGSKKWVQSIHFFKSIAIELTSQLMRPFVHFAWKINQKLNRYREKMSLLFHRMDGKIKDAFSKLEKYLFLKKLNFKPKFNIHFNLDFSEWMNAIGVKREKCLNALKKSLSQIKIKLPTLPWFKPLIRADKIAQSATNWIIDKWSKAFSLFLITPFLNRLEKQWSPLWQKFKSLSKNKIKKAGEFFQRKKHSLFYFLESKQIKLKKISHEWFCQKILSSALFKYTPFSFREKIKKILHLKVLKNVISQALNIYVFSLDKMIELSRFVINWIFKLASIARNYCKKITNRINHVCSKLKNNIILLYTRLIQFLIRLLYYFLLSITILSIVFIEALLLLSRYSNQILNRFFLSSQV